MASWVEGIEDREPDKEGGKGEDAAWWTMADKLVRKPIETHPGPFRLVEGQERECQAASSLEF